jgi:RNA polymerase sigma factor (sigma-70 family)
VTSNDREPDIDELWAQYKAEGQQELRDQLIVHYSPLVKYVAGRVASGLPQNVDQADLVSYGIFGLIDAIEKFDLDRGFKFETYAIARIKGNILDELRSIDWVPRSVRAKARALEKAYSKGSCTAPPPTRSWPPSSTSPTSSCRPPSGRSPSRASWRSTRCSPAATAAIR